MQIEVSVKKPLRGGASTHPASRAVEGRISLVAQDVARLDRDAGPAAVLLDESQQVGTGWAPAWLDVAGGCLGLLDVHVRVQGHAEQVVGAVAADDRSAATYSPVVGQPDLVDLAAVDDQRPDPFSHQHACLDGGACRDDCGPAGVVQAAFAGELGGDLAEELGL